MFNRFREIGISDLQINILRSNTSTYLKYLPEWVVYSLPDGLWVFSYVTLISAIFGNKIYGNIYGVIFLILPMTAILSELAQLFKLLQGTFDLVDLLCYTLGTFLPVFIFDIEIQTMGVCCTKNKFKLQKWKNSHLS